MHRPYALAAVATTRSSCSCSRRVRVLILPMLTAQEIAIRCGGSPPCRAPTIPRTSIEGPQRTHAPPCARIDHFRPLAFVYLSSVLSALTCLACQAVRIGGGSQGRAIRLDFAPSAFARRSRLLGRVADRSGSTSTLTCLAPHGSRARRPLLVPARPSRYSQPTRCALPLRARLPVAPSWPRARSGRL